MGFEPGSTTKTSTIVESFLRKRAEGSAIPPEQIHAIWWHLLICNRISLLILFIPISFALKFLVRERDCCKQRTRTCWRTWVMGVSIFHNLEIPVMVVFTKYHILFNEHYRDCLRDKLPPTELRVEDANRASRAFIKFTKVIEFPFVPRSSINAER